MRRLPVLVACVLSSLATACSPTFDATGNSAFSDERTSDTTLVQITSSHVGGITKDTKYSGKAVEAALPGFTTEGIQTAVEDKTEWAIAAFNTDGFQVLQVFKGKNGQVRTVHGVTHHLKGPNGERIGMTFSEVGTRRGDCRVGRNLWRGMAICKAKGTPNVQLVYAIPQYDGPFDRLPPNEELLDAMIQRILWTPQA
ncbi:DUF1131 family protein [Roseibium sp. RKSG952]|uniref:DUF1131 family protein n=1 Tax=Roseibium sp. RKSG952 TaxID=2529384 RepID=UPI0012BB920D|nr:DUF1131 family protein [Roseibium sp. RKSG952]MTH97975.1 DUF1131 family protein [Roseibium sp. RKSG952]